MNAFYVSRMPELQKKCLMSIPNLISNQLVNLIVTLFHIQSF